MSTKNSIMFKVLLNRFHPTSGEIILKCLPQSEAKDIFKQSITSKDTKAALTFSEDIVSRTHYSWLAPVIEKTPLEFREAIVAALPVDKSTKLKHLLKIKNMPLNLSSDMKKFLINKLFQAWQPQEAIPIAYLPASLLQPLLELSKSELVNLINYLALYDLAEAIRHIVDKKNLKAIYLGLDNSQQQFLHLCLHKKENVVGPKLDIEKWDKQPESFKNLLHRNGIFRLAKALCGQSSAFVWHLIHVLDIGRGSSILKHYSEEDIPKISSLLIQQVLTVINFLKKPSKT